jgi:hypothetical protein
MSAILLDEVGRWRGTIDKVKTAADEGAVRSPGCRRAPEAEDRLERRGIPR